MRFNNILTGVVLTLAVQKALSPKNVHRLLRTPVPESLIRFTDSTKKKVSEYLISKMEPFVFGPENAVNMGGLTFDKNNKNWSENPEHNGVFLNSQQNYFNDLLKARGYVFLNQVYEALGFPATQQGAVAGWTEDDTIYFFYYGDMEKLNTGEQDVKLSFNVRPNILDVLPQGVGA